MNGRDDATAFLPLDFRTGGPSEDSHSTVGQYLTRDKTRHVYKNVETGEAINADTIQQEVEQEKQLNKLMMTVVKRTHIENSLSIMQKR